MPWIAFVDEELSKEIDRKIKNKEKTKEIFPEHEFLGSCLRVGLSLNDLKELTYVDVMKVLISYIEEKKERVATQRDIDKLLG